MLRDNCRYLGFKYGSQQSFDRGPLSKTHFGDHYTSNFVTWDMGDVKSFSALDAKRTQQPD